jgi:hypothetical protein
LQRAQQVLIQIQGFETHHLFSQNSGSEVPHKRADTSAPALPAHF